MRLTFIGATGTVTGSKFLLESEESKTLIDCGLFQGLKSLRLKNWGPLPINPQDIDSVVLSHAHIDHSGYTPLLRKNGFKGFIHATHATLDLCELLLPDAGRLAEEEAGYANKKGFSRHQPALPLFTEADAEQVLTRFQPHGFDEAFSPSKGLDVLFRQAGHILGASFVEIKWGKQTLVFSGDLGRPEDPIMPPPKPALVADYLVLESTYGDRLHPKENPEETLEKVISKTIARGGTILIPAFAVARAQIVLFYIWRLMKQGRLPKIPVFMDSPMARNATYIYAAHAADHKLTKEEVGGLFSLVQFANSQEQSRALSENKEPKVIISASGMATGGRVLHHLRAFAPHEKNTILFSGYQAEGTRGSTLLSGKTSVKIHGEWIPVKAQVEQVENLSAHADQEEILQWLKGFKKAPKMVFLVHGEPRASEELRKKIQDVLGWNVYIPEYKESIELGD